MLAQAGEQLMYPVEDQTKVADFHTNGGTRVDAVVCCCLDCSGGSKSEVRHCRHVTCDLHPFRLGKNPNRTMSSEQSTIAAARLKANVTRKKNRDVG
jgi:hypothetical protein